MATTLNDVVESNLLGSELLLQQLESIDSKFDEFFKQSAKDKLDMLEMMREKDADPESPTDENNDPETVEESSKKPSLGFLGLSTLLGVLGAIQLNAMGAVGSFKALNEKIKAVPEMLKNAGTAVGEFATKAKDSVVKGFNSITKTITTKITTSETFKTLKETGGKVKEFVSGGVDKAKQLAGVAGEKVSGFFQRAKEFGSSALDKAKSFGSSAIDKTKEVASTAKSFVSDKASQLGSKAVEAFEKFQGSKAAKVLGTSVKVAAKVLKPLAVLTSGYEGYKMATEEASKDLSTAGKVAVGVGGAASAFFGGLGDFIKLATVDTSTELANRLGIISDETADKIQDFSIQKDVTDALVRGTRDAIRDLAGDNIKRESIRNVAEQGRGNVIVNNVTDASTKVSNATSVSGGNIPAPSPVNNNGTMSDAWAGA